LTLLAGCRKLKKALIGSIPYTIIINNNGAIDTAGEMLVKYLSKYGLNSKQDYGR